MADARPLDATDATQVINSVREWINGLELLDSHLWLEYVENDANGFGYCIKAEGGAITEEDIIGNFTATVPFLICYKTAFVEDDPTIYKPLNDLSAYFKANGVIGLDIGERRTPEDIITLAGPKDQYGKDEDGNVTFFSVYQITYRERAF